MDELDQQIDTHRRWVARLKGYIDNPADVRTDLATAEAALRAYEFAARVRPARNGAAAPSVETEGEPAKKRGGKPAGAISEPWRDLLRRMYADGNPFREEEWILTAAKKANIEAEPRTVADRLKRKYVGVLGFLEYSEGRGFRVTDKAIERFKLDGRQE